MVHLNTERVWVGQGKGKGATGSLRPSGNLQVFPILRESDTKGETKTGEIDREDINWQWKSIVYYFLYFR